ncbi:hypothetical protein D3C86_1880910 [compost metagenome]
MAEGDKEIVARLDPLQDRIQAAVHHKRFAASAADRIILDCDAISEVTAELLAPAFLRRLLCTVRLHSGVAGHVDCRVVTR